MGNSVRPTGLGKLKEVVRKVARVAVGVLPGPIRRPIQKWRNDRRTAKRVIVAEEGLERMWNQTLADLLERQGPEDIGNYIEFGVFNGRSMACMFRALEKANLGHVRLFGFDSFEGLPSDSRSDDEGAWKPGSFAAPKDVAEANLQSFGVDMKRVSLVQGWFSDTCVPETAQREEIGKVSLVMVDCDMYLSAKQAMDFVAPLLADDVLVFFDDWNSQNLAERNLGEKKAFDEFLAANPHYKAEELGAYCKNSFCFKLQRV